MDRRIVKELGLSIEGRIGVIGVLGREAMRAIGKVVEGMKGSGMEKLFSVVEDIEMYPGGTAWIFEG